MVNSSDFGKRIQRIMNHYAISAAAFADYMGVGRSSISHILSGRNKPSLDFVMKIVDAYDEVELQWLLYGKGEFPKQIKPQIKNVSETKNVISVPPSTSPSIAKTSNHDEDLFSQAKIDDNHQPSIKAVDQKKINPIDSGAKIERIVIFYQDGTFNSYEMKKT